MYAPASIQAEITKLLAERDQALTDLAAAHLAPGTRLEWALRDRIHAFYQPALIELEARLDMALHYAQTTPGSSPISVPVTRPADQTVPRPTVHSEAAHQPDQRVVTDATGKSHFQPNAIVCYLLDSSPFDLNHLEQQTRTRHLFSEADLVQFMQLLGISLDHFAYLPYVSDEIYARATQAASAASDE